MLAASQAEWHQARDHFLRAIVQDSTNNPIMRLSLAYACYMDKAYEQALSLYSTSIEAAEAATQSPAIGEMYFYRGLCYKALTQPEKACADFTSATQWGFQQYQLDILSFCNNLNNQ